MNTEQRFWSKVETAEGCWLWTGYKNEKGYGRFQFKGRFTASHRVAYELLVGSIPGGMEIDHLCRNTSCVNPAHLEPVTQQENWRRSQALSALNATKSECQRGHAFTPDNTYVFRRKDGRTFRNCKKCRAFRARQRSQARA